eukprot:COSAG01_NODE_28_length_36622_cov_14.695751_32_plen_92_part_00
MTDDGPSAKRRRLPGLEDALAKRALREGAGPLPWLVRDMFSGEVLEFDGRSGRSAISAIRDSFLHCRGLLAGRAGYREWCDMRNSLESLHC